MARKKRSFTKKFLVIAGVLIVAEAIVYLIFSVGEKPRSFVEEMNQKIAEDSRIPPERRDEVKLHLALRDYRAKNGSYPAQLAQLVPAYFPKVPLNPQTAEVFKYTVEGDRYYLGDAVTSQAKGGKTPGAPGEADQISVEEETALIAALDEEGLEETYAYSSSGKKDPFRSFDFSPQRDLVSSDSPLESYSYDQLKLTAVLEGFDQPKAIIENPQGKGFTVTIGTKVGDLGGEIVKIEPDRITIVETTVEFTGETKNRTVEMFLR